MTPLYSIAGRQNQSRPWRLMWQGQYRDTKYAAMRIAADFRVWSMFLNDIVIELKYKDAPIPLEYKVVPIPQYIEG